MAGEETKTVLRRVLEESFSRGDLNVIDELIDAGLVEHQSNVRPANREGLKECIRMLHAAFPDFHITVQHLSGDGDLVWAHFRASGTQTGPLGPFPATGKRMEIDGFDLARISGGRIVEHWGVPDLMAQLEQLGLLGRMPERQAAAGR